MDVHGCARSPMAFTPSLVQSHVGTMITAMAWENHIFEMDRKTCLNGKKCVEENKNMLNKWHTPGLEPGPLDRWLRRAGLQ